MPSPRTMTRRNSRSCRTARSWFRNAEPVAGAADEARRGRWSRAGQDGTLIYSGPRCSSATSRSKGRLAPASPRWLNASRRDSMPRSSSKIPRTHSSRISTRSTWRRIAVTALLPAGTPPAAQRAPSVGLVQPDHDLRLPVRSRQDLRLPDLDDNELFIYQRLFDLLARDVRLRISSSIPAAARGAPPPPARSRQGQ